MARTYKRPADRVLEREAKWARRLTNRGFRHRTRAAVLAGRPDSAPAKAPRTQGWITW